MGDQSGRGSRIFLLLKETNLGVAPAFFDPLKVNKTSLKTKLLHFSRATLSETLKAKKIGDFSSTPYTPKRDDEHPHLFSR